MARDGEDDGRIMAQSQSITGGRLSCSRDGGGGPAFLQGEQTTKLLAVPPDSRPGLAVMDPCHPGQPNPSPEPSCAVGALACRGTQQQQQQQQHRVTTQALAWSSVLCSMCCVLCAVTCAVACAALCC